jgi:hypothetical protein
VRRKPPARSRPTAETASAATMPPVGAVEAPEAGDDDVVVDEAPEAGRPKAPARRRPVARKPEKGGE